MSNPRGYVIYRGPSLLNGSPIVAIAITASGNRKTGNMVQTYILVDNGIKPTANVASGADVSICGDCKHRPSLDGFCYVVTAQGPTVVYKSFLAGKYPAVPVDLVAEMISGRMVRLGTYGDPAAVPSDVWSKLVAHASGHTGYTHQWRRPHSVTLRGLCMASTDTPEERETARASGWRTFTVRTPDQPLAARESICPASAEGGYKLTCNTCGLCNGAQGRKGSIAIIVHGYRAGSALRRAAA